MRADQAIYTSLPRNGRDGYHVVSRSRGVSEADARALAAWCPSHGALIVDDENRSSVNIHPVSDGRMAISRTIKGRSEYSGRGGRQVYTHAILVDSDAMRRSEIVPIALYLDALALGVFRYQPDPAPVLEEVELGDCHRAPGIGDPAPISANELIRLRERLAGDDPVELRHSGNRRRFVEQLVAALPGELAASLSISTSLTPSTARPFALRIIP